jgi:GNAT superfamily N-acetyltransferase
MPPGVLFLEAMVDANQYVVRPARLTPGRSSGKPVLQEVCSFGEYAAKIEEAAGILNDVCPLGLFAPDRLSQCDEAFVAEQGGQIVGAATLAFNGVYEPRVPTLDALYVLPAFHRKGIGFALVVTVLERFCKLGKTPIFCKIKSVEMRDLLERLKARRPDLHCRIRIVLDC